VWWLLQYLENSEGEGGDSQGVVCMETGTLAMAAGAFVGATQRHQQWRPLHRGTAAGVIEGRLQESVISCLRQCSL
jgi:hypothetical protein